MKRLFASLLVLLTLLSSVCFAATKADVIAAINATYKVGDETFRLPQKYINRGTSYLNEHPLTSEQYSQILGCINSAVAYCREIGHVRYKEYTKEQINKGLSIVAAACRAAEVDMEEEAKKIDEPEATTPVTTTPAQNQTPASQDPTGTSVTTDNPASSINVTTDNPASSTNVGNPTTENPSSSKPIVKITADGQKVLVNESGEIIDENPDIASIEAASTNSGETVVKTFYDENDFITIDGKDGYIDIDDIYYPKDANDEIKDKINIRLFIIYIIAFSVLILNIFLIRLIFKKKWNKIRKTVLMVLLGVISILIIIAIIITLYYIEELKLVLELYYLLK